MRDGLEGLGDDVSREYHLEKGMLLVGNIIWRMVNSNVRSRIISSVSGVVWAGVVRGTIMQVEHRVPPALHLRDEWS